MKEGIPYDMFGMPSGHSQSSLFSSLFLFLSLRDTRITLFYLFLSLITALQRVVYNYHTVFQVIVGAMVGLLFGYAVYFVAGEKLKGKIREKRDDFGPL
jgi:membrane-associated phospholipid phosphatase